MAAKKKVTKKAPAKKPVLKKKPSAAKKSPAKKPAGKKSFDSKHTLPKKPAAKRAAPARSSKATARKSKRPAARPARPPRRARASTGVVLENPEALALARVIAGAALEKKALDVLIIDTRARGSAVGYDYVVLATGESDRQLEAIASGIEDAAASQQRKPSVEASPDWVLSNFDDVVAHFFTADKRAAYDLEGLWSDAPRVPLS
jgi:ribosome-associated protein